MFIWILSTHHCQLVCINIVAKLAFITLGGIQAFADYQFAACKRRMQLAYCSGATDVIV